MSTSGTRRTGAAACALLVALLASTSATGRGDTGPEFVDNDFLGEQAVRSRFDPQDFSLDFNTSLASSGGSVQIVTLGTDPVLGALTSGFGHAIYNFEPCGVVPAHVHPRGDENVFVLSGTADVGFVDEAGALIRNPALAEGTGFVVPQGYIHFVANPTCEPARTLVTAPASDAGSSTVIPALLALPLNILQASVPSLDAGVTGRFQADVAAAGRVSLDPTCVERCGAASESGRY